MPPRRVLAIDPGRWKCGLAVVDAEGGLVAREIVSTEALPGRVQEWCERYRPDLLLLGGGTGSRGVVERLGPLSVPLRRVPEHETTRRARARYFAEHPPRGWRRLIPLSLQTPPLPIDDFAAWIMADDFLASQTVD